MSSLKTSLNADDFVPPALNGDNQGAPQAPEQNPIVQNHASQPQQADTGDTKPHEPAIPYPRFQEVTHENQTLRAQVQEYQQRLNQVQQYQQQYQQPLSGMQPPAQQQHQPQLTAQQQQQVDSFREQLSDPAKSKEWQARIAKEGPAALHDFVAQAVRDTGSQLLGEALRPILEKVSLIEGDYISNTINQYASNVQDPEFTAYRHIFEDAVRHVAPNNNIRNPQVLDTIRYWASAQYRAQYGQAPQQPQYQQQYPPQQQYHPPVSERPGSPYGFQQQGQQNRFAKVDSDLASRFGLDPADIQAARNRTVRGG